GRGREAVPTPAHERKGVAFHGDLAQVDRAVTTGPAGIGVQDPSGNQTHVHGAALLKSGDPSGGGRSVATPEWNAKSEGRVPSGISTRGKKGRSALAAVAVAPSYSPVPSTTSPFRPACPVRDRAERLSRSTSVAKRRDGVRRMAARMPSPMRRASAKPVSRRSFFRNLRRPWRRGARRGRSASRARRGRRGGPGGRPPGRGIPGFSHLSERAGRCRPSKGTVRVLAHVPRGTVVQMRTPCVSIALTVPPQGHRHPLKARRRVGPEARKFGRSRRLLARDAGRE